MFFIKIILKLIKKYFVNMKYIKKILVGKLQSDIVIIHYILNYILNSVGKKIRPKIIIMISKSLGYKGNYNNLLSVVIETIHIATILHDDVIDISDIRRCNKTINSIFGNSASILIGDYLYSKSFEIILELNSINLMNILSKAVQIISEGEILQLINLRCDNTSQERYLQIIRYKTSKLFEVSALFGSILAKAKYEHERSAINFGRHIGTAFQLVDDIIDYKGVYKMLGKNSVNDLREGKPTLPIIRIMEIGKISQKLSIRYAIEKNKFDIHKISKILKETDSIKYTIKLAHNEIKLALKSLLNYPNSKFKNYLFNFCRFIINRSL